MPSLESLPEEPPKPAGRRIAAPVIETARLRLRPPGLADAPDIVALADDEAVARNLVGMPHPYRLPDAIDWIEAGQEDDGQKHLILLRAPGGDDRVVGAATLDRRRGASLATLGVWFGSAYWGLGLATEACHAVIDYAFLHQGHERLSFTCRAVNVAGRRVIEKCGFQVAAQELAQSAYHRSVIAVDRFVLDRRTWEGLRDWAPLRLAPEGSGRE